MKKILVIEDELSLRQNLLDLLDAEDFDAVGADNGRIGIKLAQQTVPDLIICDVMMPELDGYEVVKTLRRNPATATIPFIFLTAKADKTDLRQGMELGADDYLTKPFTRGGVLGAIASRLEKQAAIHQQSQKKLDELRSSITMSLPHEMRTPLNGIMGFSQLLITEANILCPEEIQQMAENIYKSGDRLYRLIQNFLLYAELELMATAPDRVKRSRGDRTSFPSSVFQDLILEKAKKVNREGDLHLELHPCTIQIAETRLNKIVEELVDNAFKFSSVGTPVCVTNTSSNNTFALSVIDYGRGMTVEQITDLGAYRQFERKLYEQQGSGLGLVIAKRLTELHGGEFNIYSIPSKQTTVRVTLTM